LKAAYNAVLSKRAKKKGSVNANLLPLARRVADETDSSRRIESSDQTNYLMHSVIISRSGSHGRMLRIILSLCSFHQML
jgi:hypothetical protein